MFNYLKIKDMTTQNNGNTIAPTHSEQHNDETPNKVISQQPEKTWDGPLGQAIRTSGTGHGYTQPQAEPRTETIETGNQQPLSNPDEVQPQTQQPTVIQQPVAINEQQPDSEQVENDAIDHSEKGILSRMNGYNEEVSRQEHPDGSTDGDSEKGILSRMNGGQEENEDSEQPHNDFTDNSEKGILSRMNGGNEIEPEENQFYK
jgi:hypothetical protein